MTRLLLVVLLAAGCGESTKSIVEKEKAAAEPRLAQIAAIAADVPKQPPAKGETFTLPQGVALHFRWAAPEHNASVTYDHALPDPCGTAELHWKDKPNAPDYLGPLDTASDWLRPASCLVKTGKWWRDTENIPPEMVKEAFTRLARTKYLVVVRVAEAKCPVIGEDSTFEGGHMAGDALVYEVEGAKLLGSFSWQVESKDTVEVKGGGQADQLMYDLLTDAAWVLRDKLGKAGPGTPPP
jgi:hypothetical protein